MDVQHLSPEISVVQLRSKVLAADSCKEIKADLISYCPHARVLVTSHQPLVSNLSRDVVKKKGVIYQNDLKKTLTACKHWLPTISKSRNMCSENKQGETFFFSPLLRCIMCLC